MNRWWRPCRGRSLLVAMALLGPVWPGATETVAQEVVSQPRVKVQFSLAEPAFVSAYCATTRAAIADSCARGIAAVLASSLGFLAFTADDTTNVLSVTLGTTAAARPPGGVWPVHLHLDLTGAAVDKPTTAVHWEYRSEAQLIDLIPPAEELIRDMILLVRTRLEREGGSGELVENLFSKMVLAHRAFALREESGFLLPINRGPWRIGPESEFKIVADITAGATRQEGRTHKVIDVGDCIALADGVPPFFLSKIQVLVIDEPHKVEALRSAQEVVAREIFLTVYRAPRDTVAITTPTGLDLGGVQR